MTLNPLSAHNNNNSSHKFGFKFYMRAGDQKLKYNLEWPYCIKSSYSQSQIVEATMKVCCIAIACTIATMHNYHACTCEKYFLKTGMIP